MAAFDYSDNVVQVYHLNLDGAESSKKLNLDGVRKSKAQNLDGAKSFKRAPSSFHDDSHHNDANFDKNLLLERYLYFDIISLYCKSTFRQSC